MKEGERLAGFPRDTIALDYKDRKTRETGLSGAAKAVYAAIAAFGKLLPHNN